MLTNLSSDALIIKVSSKVDICLFNQFRFLSFLFELSKTGPADRFQSWISKSCKIYLRKSLLVVAKGNADKRHFFPWMSRSVNQGDTSKNENCIKNLNELSIDSWRCLTTFIASSCINFCSHSYLDCCGFCFIFWY